ncbi:MAG: DUF3040 domain-containing protein [Actinomycetaceae bacterium]|nr:DUF3040 domain-containing protein [Arcanobacterium sp.]MDD7687352.1 DUF3040 domain-containing protein [Actinomycetaceae bacterium]MDY5274121.1 DUF3040 domain-containing protein [Arcanobacterium sp.]
MALTDEEREMLAQLEAQLAHEDPAFVKALAHEEESADVPAGLSISPKHLVLGLIVAVVGLIVVLSGVMIEVVPLGIVGAVIVFAGFWYLVSGPRSERQEAKVRSRKPQRSKSSYMERQAEAWERRRKERGM